MMFAQVRFTVYSGLYNEYLNCLIENGYIIEEIVHNQFGFTAACRAADYRQIAFLSRKYQCKVRIDEKKGILFPLQKILKRKGLVCGIAAFMVLSYIFSHMVWQININIQDEEIRNRIAAKLFYNNIYTGVFYDKEYFENVCKTIVQSDEDISYVNLNFYKGTLECKVSMRKYREDYLDRRQEENIYAALDGVVTDMRVYDGFSRVQPGQSVSAGDVLVSVTDTDKFGNTATSAVRAYIEGLCTKEYSVFVPFEKEAFVYTGAELSEKYLYFMGGEYRKEKADLSRWSDYSSTSVLKYGSLFGFRFPFTIKTVTYYERSTVPVSHNLLTAQYAARTQLQHIISDDVKLKNEIDRQIDYSISDDGVTAVCRVYGYYDMAQ